MFYNEVYEACCWAKKLNQNGFEKWPNVHLIHNWLQFDAQSLHSGLEVVRLLAQHLTV